MEIRERCPSESGHDERSDDPIEDEGQTDLPPDLGRSKDGGQELVLDFCERGPHHDDQTEDDGEGDVVQSDLVEGGVHVGRVYADHHAEHHGDDDPYRQPAVEEAQRREQGCKKKEARWWARKRDGQW